MLSILYKHTFKENEEVYYISDNGDYLKAKILKIHHDDVEPYYTIYIHILKREKQTVYKNLKRLLSNFNF